MSSIELYKDSVEHGAIVVQDLAIMATPWVKGVTAPDPLFDEDGVVGSALTSLGLKSLGMVDQKAGANLTPDVSFNDIMGYGSRSPRRRILQNEGLAIDFTPSEARKITMEIQNNLAAGAFTQTTTGGFRTSKLAGGAPRYWSLFILGLDFNDETGGDILPWWFIPKVGLDKPGKTSMQMDTPMMAPTTLTMFQDGDNLWEFGIDGAGWADLASSMGFVSPRIVTITGGPTGGTFTLSIGGQTTSAIPFNATGTTVQAALVALSSVGVGHVTVSGSAGGPYTITFDETVSGTLTASGASLTGGTSPAVNVVAA